MPHLPPIPDFEVLGPLAKGGMAEIYRARAVGGVLAGRDVALKRLLPIYRDDPRFVALFVEEARLGAGLVHPHIVRTHELLRAGPDYLIVQEFVPGATLAQLRRRAWDAGGRLAAGAALCVVEDLLAALCCLHEGGGRPDGAPIVHRDVNPDNIVVTAHGVAKLIDFGIAQEGGRTPAARPGALLGTPAYMSPEQVRGWPLDAGSDVFSAGVVFWELLAGRPLFAAAAPFEVLRLICEESAPPLGTVVSDVGAALERVAARALARERRQRFVSAGEMLAEFREACEMCGCAPDRDLLATEMRRHHADDSAPGFEQTEFQTLVD